MTPPSTRPIAHVTRLREQGIVCLVSDRRVTTTEVLQAAIDAGVDLIQVRERDLDGRALSELTRTIVQMARGSTTRVVVNDRLDVALASGADGVHLRSDSFAAHRVRRLAPRSFLVGRSIHSEAEVGVGIDADYLVFGTVFPTASKPPGHVVAGLEGLRAACARATVPVLAIGGLSVERAPSVASAGAAGVAGIGLFSEADGLEETVRRLRAAFRIPPSGER